MAVATQAGIFSVGANTNQIRQGNDIDIKIAEALDSISSSGNALLSRIAALEAASGSAVPFVETLHNFGTLVTLGAPTTLMTFADPVNEWDSLSYGILQDVTGGRAITWGANLLGASVVLDPAAGVLNIFPFVARINPNGGLLTWFLNGLPNLGIVI